MDLEKFSTLIGFASLVVAIFSGLITYKSFKLAQRDSNQTDAGSYNSNHFDINHSNNVNVIVHQPILEQVLGITNNDQRKKVKNLSRFTVAIILLSFIFSVVYVLNSQWPPNSFGNFIYILNNSILTVGNTFGLILQILIFAYASFCLIKWIFLSRPSNFIKLIGLISFDILLIFTSLKTLNVLTELNSPKLFIDFLYKQHPANLSLQSTLVDLLPFLLFAQIIASMFVLIEIVINLHAEDFLSPNRRKYSIINFLSYFGILILIEYIIPLYTKI
ncbi:hypothetical protein LAE98_10515 [Bacillus wiedmannii]|uniref:hypothetical protein n=1 Tax=Bacillus wiedmannii TaxID=1890302 RepID=UPI001CBBD2E6|nr:hypothetical protein [Bacillus wiedmannii]MBZ4222532.1 hypothetical protein [Bacillus wiedmannii]